MSDEMPALAARLPISRKSGIVTRSALLNALATSTETVASAADQSTSAANNTSPATAIDAPTGTCSAIMPSIMATPISRTRIGLSGMGKGRVRGEHRAPHQAHLHDGGNGEQRRNDRPGGGQGQREGGGPVARAPVVDGPRGHLPGRQDQQTGQDCAAARAQDPHGATA